MHPATIFYSRLVVGSAVEPSRDDGARIVIGLRERPLGVISWYRTGTNVEIGTSALHGIAE